MIFSQSIPFRSYFAKLSCRGSSSIWASLSQHLLDVAHFRPCSYIACTMDFRGSDDMSLHIICRNGLFRSLNHFLITTATLYRDELSQEFPSQTFHAFSSHFSLFQLMCPLFLKFKSFKSKINKLTLLYISLSLGLSHSSSFLCWGFA